MISAEANALVEFHEDEIRLVGDIGFALTNISSYRMTVIKINWFLILARRLSRSSENQRSKLPTLLWALDVPLEIKIKFSSDFGKDV